MKKEIASWLFIALGVFFFLLMLKLTLPYFSFRYDVDFLLTKQSVLHVTVWRLAFYTHISSSLFVLLFGAFQFSKKLMFRFSKVHRLLGKIYVCLVLFVSAPSGLIMAFYANGGIAAKTSFAIISVLWWYFTFTAYRQILKRNFNKHLAYMFRSYALTLSAITLRTYVLLLPYFIHLHGVQMYTLVAWLSWVPNLIIAEFWIRRTSLRISNFSE
ncbi:MAG: hypothetical protein JWP12_2742 [Bacteroidetes bacterium]|nr:hypothetical protein [Bacteroidota bacterium]